MQPDSITADGVLAALRPLVLVVDGLGEILDVRGGCGGFFGWQLDELPGRNVLELVHPAEVAEVATYFVSASAEAVRSVPMPMPFRVTLRDADGGGQDVDVIPTGCIEHGQTWGWVALLVPLSLQSSNSRSLNAELAGRPRQEVCQRLTEELGYDNSWGRLVWYLVDLADPDLGMILTGPRDDPGAGAALRTAIRRGWKPWEYEPDGFLSSIDSTTFFAPLLAPRHIPDDLHGELRSQGWTRLSVVPVVVDGEVAAAYLALARLPAEDDSVVRTNSDQRIASLLDLTKLLITRWRNEDRLEQAARSDSLTGVANRDGFQHALDRVDGPYAVLYVDIDCFKDVNDRFGHVRGDEVLVDVARRIEAACRPDDLVARFGGDEFVVLLRDVDTATAAAIGERLVAAGSVPADAAGDGVRVTLSVGLAFSTADVDPIDAADRAMLTAKRLGRDRLVTI